MKEHSRLSGQMEYDSIFAGLNPPPLVGGGTLAGLEATAVYKRGTILAKSGQNSQLYILGSTAA